MKRFLKVSMAALALLFVACGKGGESPPPAAPAPAGPPAAPTFGGNLEDTSPGEPLSQTNYQQSFQLLRQNLMGRGTGTMTGQTIVSYNVQPGYRDALFTRQQNTSQPQAPQQPASAFLIEGYNGNYLEEMGLYFQSHSEGRLQMELVMHYDLYGKRLFTTNQLALFVASGGGRRKLLKVMYAAANPPMTLYTIEEYSGGYGNFNTYTNYGTQGGQILLNVLQQNFSTQITAQQPGQYPR